MENLDLTSSIDLVDFYEGGDKDSMQNGKPQRTANDMMQKRRSRLAESNSRSPTNFNNKTKMIRASSKKVTKQSGITSLDQQNDFQNDHQILIDDMAAGHYGSNPNNIIHGINGSMSTKSKLQGEEDEAHYQNVNS